MRTLLLNPGPVTLTERVRHALLRPDLCHREPEFADLQQGIRDKLLGIYGLDKQRWAAILLTGSGTAAVEAMISSLVPPSSHLWSVENGVYGERISRIADVHGIQCTPVHQPWGAPLQNDLLADAMSASASAGKRIGVVHHETTSGRLNPIEEVATAAAAHSGLLLLDAVSSFGAEEIRFDDWHLAACAATANKCLHGVPGTSFVIARRDLLTAASTPRTVYFDLATYLKAQDAGTTPFTQSVQTFYALDAALDEFIESGGWQARRRRYRELMQQVRDGLAKLHIEPLLPSADSSCVLNAFRLPDGMDYDDLHDDLKQRGFIIYAGQGQWARDIFRISVMGDISAADIERLLRAFAELCRGR